MSALQISRLFFATRLSIVVFSTLFFTTNFFYVNASDDISDDFDVDKISTVFKIPRIIFLRDSSWCYIEENDFKNFTCTQPITQSEFPYTFKRVFQNCAFNETLLVFDGNNNELFSSRSRIGSALTSLIKFATVPDLRTVLDLEIDWSSNILYFLYRTKRDIKSSGNLMEIKLAVILLRDVVQKREIIPYRLIGTVFSVNEKPGSCQQFIRNTFCGIERTSSLQYHPGLTGVILTLGNKIYLLRATRANTLANTNFEVSILKFKVPSMERFTLSGVDWVSRDLMIRLAERNEEFAHFEMHYLRINETTRVPLHNIVFLDESYVFRVNNGGTRSFVQMSEIAVTSNLYYKSMSPKLIHEKLFTTSRPFSFSSEFFITVDKEQRETLVQYVANSGIKNSSQFIKKEIFNDILVTSKADLHYCGT